MKLWIDDVRPLLPVIFAVDLLTKQRKLSKNIAVE